MIEDDEEPSPEFVKGYNDGYQLAKHKPELLDKILSSQDSSANNVYM